MSPAASTESLVSSPAAVEGAAPEFVIARDLLRRALMIAPAAIVVCGLIWGLDGALSSAYALVIVMANFLLAAALMAKAARISVAALMGAVMGGYVLRLALITAAVLAISGQSWFLALPLGFTLIIAHLGLLIWEARYVSASLAFPALKPDRKA